MANPKYSVVIPTRERPATLRYALRTCLAQDFDDYEIVVSDNFGGPATREVVEEAASKRIRYVRSDRLLSMSSNWELAVAQARGEYVLVLGDDDALLGHALREIDRIVTAHKERVLRWTAAFYTWPTINMPGDANYLRIPLARELRRVQAVPQIASVIRFESCYSTLPMFYNAAIHRTVIDNVRGKIGRLFPNIYPDVFSCFAVGYAAGSYLSCDVPMSIAATSGGSFGVANLFHRGKSPLDREFRDLNREEQLQKHRWVADLPLFPFVPVADSFQIAKELLFPKEKTVTLDRRALATQCAYAIPAWNDDDRRAALAAIADTFADDRSARAWFETTFCRKPPAPPPPFRMRASVLGFDGDFLHLGADQFGVTDVCGAADVCEKILNIGKGPIRFDVKPMSRLKAA
jgi:glycosyltransferase involved in cell wall biosynthesis